MAKQNYLVSPFGVMQHPWLNKPDTKYKEDGEFKVDLVLSGTEAAKLKEDITAEVDAAFKEWQEDPEKGGKFKPADLKKWSPYYPFEDDTDDAGELTGTTTFKFKQNAKIKLRDGEVRELEITVVDGKNQAVTRPVFSGSEGRIMYKPRAIAMVSAKQVGVRLDFAKVQVTKYGSGNGGGQAFDEVQGLEDHAEAGDDSYA